MIASQELVSVVVPAYNSENTLDETLHSVRAQTHAALEVAVVVDGATDGTEAVARRHAAADQRIQIAVTPNRGVIAARNAGVAMTRGAFIAPIDADDLWHPEKIEREMAVMAASGPDTGFVYSQFRLIDLKGHVLADGYRTDEAGALFLRSLFANFVGNGSGMLMRREAFLSVGGYDATLRRLGLEGTEDNLIQTMISRRWRVAGATGYLVGYRRHSATVSSDMVRMLLSRRATLAILSTRYPDMPPDLLAEAEAAVAARLAIALATRFRVAAAVRELAAAMRRSPAITAAIFTHAAGGTARKAMEALFPARDRPRFFDLAPETAARPVLRRPLRRRVDALAERDEAFFAADPAG